MLTSRGWWFLVFVLTMLAASLLSERVNRGLAFLAGTMLCWFLAEWGLFAVGIRRLRGALEIHRELADENGVVTALWVGRPCIVRVIVRLRGEFGYAHCHLAERLPFGAEPLDGDIACEGPLEADLPTGFEYRLRCDSPGQLRFEGVRLRLADLHGLFHHAAFLQQAFVYRVMPSMVDAKGRAASTKRHNLLPPPGIHRLRRPGTGSELHDLRDYLPGDPPKTIAWKASAKRDRLITKEYESEVPVRCTLFLDVSCSVRPRTDDVPDGEMTPDLRTLHSPLGQLVEIAAAVAQANSANRDMTGLCLFDDRHATTIRPARGPRHLAQLMRVLTDAAALTADATQASLDETLPIAYAFAQEVYPELLQPEVNAFPFWLPWLFPQPAYTVRDRREGDRLYGCLPVFLIGYAAMLMALLGAAFVGLDWLLRPPLVASAVFGYVILLLLALLGLFGCLLAVPTMLFPTRRRRYRLRKRLAALLSVRHGLGPGGLALLLEDDEFMVIHLQKFLAEHRVPFPLPEVDDQGRRLFLAKGKIDVLAVALLRSVRWGHDNELFVVLADLLDLVDDLEPFLRAVKVAVARHHRLVVVCCWPLDAPTPAPPEPTRAFAEEHERANRYDAAYHQLRRTLGKFGVPVIRALPDDSIHLILDRLDRLRTLGRSR